MLGMRQVVGEIDFLRARHTDLNDGKLRTILVNLDASLHFDEVVAIDITRCDLELIPHSRFNRPAAIAKFHAQIGASLARISHFLLMDEEKASDGLFGE